MSAVSKLQPISIDDYLAGELESPVKHEYLGGFVYAMAGVKNVHNLIATNVLGVLHARLRGGRCRPYNSDTKIRIRLPSHVRFYYPDASVICRPNSQDDTFQDDPALIAEVLSSKTRRIDLGEKKDAYLTIASLAVYLAIEQAYPSIIVYRRTEQGFVLEEHSGMDAVISVPEIGAELPLTEVYDGVEFSPEVDDEDDDG
jgi:Uma2 family endonuclease